MSSTNTIKRDPTRRFRVEPLTHHGGRRRWRVVDDEQNGVTIWPGGTLSEANLTAYRLNHDHLWGHSDARGRAERSPIRVDRRNR